MHRKGDIWNWGLLSAGIILTYFLVGCVIIQMRNPPRLERVEAAVGYLMQVVAVLVLATAGLSLWSKNRVPFLGGLLGIVLCPVVMVAFGLLGTGLHLLLVALGLPLPPYVVWFLLIMSISLGLMLAACRRTPRRPVSGKVMGG